MLPTVMEIYFPSDPKGVQGWPLSTPFPFFNIRSHTFAEFYHEIIFKAVLLPSSDTRRVVVSYKQRYMRSTG